VLDKLNQVGYDERQALDDGRIYSSAARFECVATAFTLTATTWWATLLRTIPHRTHFRRGAKPTGTG
jgi:hypothetical protein